MRVFKLTLILAILAMFGTACHGLKAGKVNPFIIQYDSTKLEIPKTVYPLDMVDTKTSYKDGNEALLSFISRELQYPQDAIDAGKQGIAVVRVFTDDAGNAMNKYLITKALGYGMDEAALEVVSKLDSQWSPAIYQGNPVRSFIDVPVRFELPK